MTTNNQSSRRERPTVSHLNRMLSIQYRPKCSTPTNIKNVNPNLG